MSQEQTLENYLLRIFKQESYRKQTFLPDILKLASLFGRLTG